MSNRIFVDGSDMGLSLWDECEDFVHITYTLHLSDGNIEDREERGKLSDILAKATIYLKHPESFKSLCVMTQEQYQFEQIVKHYPDLRAM